MSATNPVNFTLKQGDLLPAIREVLSDVNGVPINLTGASVTFIMRQLGATAPKVSAPAAVVDALNGIVQYTWLAGDTSQSGGFAVEWLLNFNGVPETVPSQGYAGVLISKNLQGGTPTPPPPPSSPFFAQIVDVLTPLASDGVSVNATGIAANAGSNVMGGAFTNPDTPRCARGTFPVGWDGGNLVVSGIDQFGQVNTDTLAPNPGGFTDGTKVFASITSCSKSAVGVSAVGVATLGRGSHLGIVGTGGIAAHLVNAFCLGMADGAVDNATIDVANNSFVPTTPPNGAVSYKLIVNV
jgi:hypothetical protein